MLKIPMRVRRGAWRCAGSIGLAIAFGSVAMGQTPYENHQPWGKPEKVEPGEKPGDPPSDAIVLFDGESFDAWDGDTSKWVVKDGYAIAGSNLQTKQKFGDCQLHIEFAAPEEDDGTGQGKGNNGLGFMGGRYEIQVLDSYENETYYDGQAGAVYKQHPPLVNPTRPTGKWQSYDILFTAPTFNKEGRMKSPAAVTVFLNGVVVQNHYVLSGDTAFNHAPRYVAHGEREPFVLMYHSDPVRFRNIWIRDLEGDAGIAQLDLEKEREQQADARRNRENRQRDRERPRRPNRRPDADQPAPQRGPEPRDVDPARPEGPKPE